MVIGTEPNLRWRAFAGSLVDVAHEFHARVVVTMGALLADTPHTRPVPVSASASDPEMMAKHALTPSTYEGPTGIVGVLHDACTEAGIQSASLWAATPHYISAAPNPQAAVALLERLLRPGGRRPGRPTSCRRPPASTRCGWPSAITDDPDIAGYVEQLEEQVDSQDAPTGDELAADFERLPARAVGG